MRATDVARRYVPTWGFALDTLEPLVPLQVAACPRVVRVRAVQIDARVPPGEPPTTAARVRMAHDCAPLGNAPHPSRAERSRTRPNAAQRPQCPRTGYLKPLVATPNAASSASARSHIAQPHCGPCALAFLKAVSSIQVGPSEPIARSQSPFIAPRRLISLSTTFDPER